MSEISYFKVHLDTRPIIEDLSYEDVGRIFLAMYDYAENNNLPDFPKGSALKVAGSAMIATLDRAKRKYNKRLSDEERKEINRANGKKGGAPKGNQNAKKKPASSEKKTKTVAESKASQEPPADYEYYKTMFSSMQKALKTTYDTNLFKLMECLDVIEFLALCGLMECTSTSPFECLYNNGVRDFMADFENFGNPKKYLKSFEKHAKQEYLDLSENHTIDSYNADRTDFMNSASYVVVDEISPEE